MGRRLHSEGRGALQDEEGGTHLPITEPVRWTVTLLSEGANGFWRLGTIALGAATLGLLALRTMSRSSPFTPLAAGAVVAAGFSFLAWLIAGILSRAFESAVDREIMLILRDGGWLGLRNALALTAASLAALYLWRGLVAPRLRGREPEGDYYWPEAEEPSAYPPEQS
jgi:hypothetical protein